MTARTGHLRDAAAGVLSGSAGLLVLLALTAPHRLQDLESSTFVRLPLEALAFLALVLVLPGRLGRLRTLLALASGALLGVVALLKVLDMSFFESLNRPFDAAVDWRYAGSLVGLVRDSFGNGLGNALLAVAGVVVLALLVLMPLAVLRLTRLAARHRERSYRVLALLVAVWLVLALVDVRSGDGAPVASREASGYVYQKVSAIPSELRDQRQFAGAAERDPLRTVPAKDLLTRLRGKDVLFVFVESYGRAAVQGSSFSPGVRAVLASGQERLAAAGFSGRSAFLTSPTFGAISWLAHATLQSGLWVDSQQRYDALMTSPRQTLSHAFGRAGWRTVGDSPANTRDWPQGAFYGYDQLYDARNVGYRGPRFGYPTMPDQYTLEAFHRLELAPAERRPVMAEIDLVSSHAPWSRTPRMVDQAAVGDGSVYDGMPEQLPSEKDIWPSPQRVRAAYGKAVEYSLASVFEFLETRGSDDLVLVLLGDHQPATIVSGDDADHDVPVSVIARDPAVLDRITDWGWQAGLLPRPDAPVWRMDAFRDRFLAAYGPGGPH